jgi:hypothetical protein
MPRDHFLLKENPMAKNDDKKPETEVEPVPAKEPEMKIEALPVAAKVAGDAGLVKMIKGDQVLYVHPTCVKAHEEAEWEVA